MIKKSKLFRAIDPCVKIFRFFGFTDIFVSRNSSVQEKVSAAWIVFRTLVVLGILIYELVETIHRQLNALQDSSRIPVYRILFTTAIIGGFMSLLLTLANSSKSAEFLKRIKEVDELFLNNLSIKIDHGNLRWTLLINLSLVFVHIFGSVITITLAALQQLHLLRLGLFFHFPATLMRIYMQRFIFMVQLTTFYLREIVKELEKLINNQPVIVRKEDIRSWKWNTKRNHLRIKVMKTAYRKLWQASCLINESFGVGLSYMLFMQILSFLYQGYSVCTDIANGQRINRQLIQILLTLFGIFMIHYYCQQCLNSVIY